MSALPLSARLRLLAAGCALVLFLPIVLPARATQHDSPGQNPPTQTPPPQNPPAQNPPAGQQPVFRGATDVVRVDVFPRRDGRIVTGLAREDFQVFEDEKAQTIETFEFVPIEREGEPLDPRDGREARRMAEDARNRVFVFYLDTYFVTFEGSARAREPLLQFLRQDLGPRDLFAVLTPRQSPDLLEFSQSALEAAGYITVTRPWGEYDAPMTDPFELELDTCDPQSKNFPYPGPLVHRWRWAQMFSDLEGLLAHLGALRPERKNLIVVSERWQWEGRFRAAVQPAPHPRANQSGGQRARGSFEPPKPVSDHATKCETMTRSLTGVDNERRRRDLVEQARRANVAMYFLSPAPKQLFSGLNLAKQMADETDGLAPVSNDFHAGLQRIVEHQTGYYMLGYRSTQGVAGSRPRTIRVRTRREGVDLDVRRVYQPPTDDELARTAAARPPPARTDVETALDALQGLRDETEVFVHAAASAGRLDVTVELSANAARSRWRDGAEVSLVVRDDAGGEIAREASNLPAGVRSTRISLPLPAGNAALKAAVRITRGDDSASEIVDVPREGTALLGPPLLFRSGSLPRQPFTPAADRRFDRTGRLRLEWPVHGTLTAFTVRVLNSRGEERPADVAIADAAAGAALKRADLRLIPIAAGDYVIEAVAHSGDQRVRQLIAVRVQ